MDDPTRRRSPGSWPRDAPIRWGGLVRNLGWFLGSTACLIVQLGLVALVIANGEAPRGPLLAIAWGAATLATAWAWLLGRRWIVVPPIVTVVAILALASPG